MRLIVACCVPWLAVTLLVLQSDGDTGEIEITRLGDDAMIQVGSLTVDEIRATVIEVDGSTHCNCHCYCDRLPGRPGPSAATLIFQGFYYCQTGSTAVSLPHNCAQFDFDEDGDVDLMDFAQLAVQWNPQP